MCLFITNVVFIFLFLIQEVMPTKSCKDLITECMAICCILCLTLVGLVGVIVGCNTRLPGACPTGPHEHAGAALWIAGVVCLVLLLCLVCIGIGAACYDFCGLLCEADNKSSQPNLEPLPTPSLVFKNNLMPNSQTRTTVPADAPSVVIDLTQSTETITSTDFQ